MPELPEVETTVRQLRAGVVGRRIIKAWSDWPRFFKFSSPKEFFQRVKGARIESVERRGKNIIFHLRRHNEPRDLILLVHQKMTGHFLLGRWELAGGQWKNLNDGPLGDKTNSYIHLVFYLSGGLMLALSDARKFAKVVLGTPSAVESSEHLRLGVEALSPDLTERNFSEIIKKERRKIKTVLLDQKIIAGLGNIYSDEVLWYAKISPLRRANSLAKIELEGLYRAMRRVLKKAIRLCGASMSDYRDLYGRPGGYMSQRAVYRRGGESCLQCGAKIKRIKIGGRSSYFCPKCQR